MDTSAYIKYCFECECEGVIPLPIEVINEDSKMLKVKEFKALYGVVIRGDVLHQNHKPDGGVFVAGMPDFDDCTIKSFAWRINTKGVKPVFTGIVEFELTSGYRGVCKMSMLLGFGAGSLDPVFKWRPLLDQSGVKPIGDKPVFTQDMADADELPPVGSKCIIEYVIDVETFDKEAIIQGVFGGKVWFCRADESSVDFTASLREVRFKPIDTRTPKQKAVDRMLLELNLSKHSHYEVVLTKAYEVWFECN